MRLKFKIRKVNRSRHRALKGKRQGTMPEAARESNVLPGFFPLGIPL